jgi:hypothetical protein
VRCHTQNPTGKRSQSGGLTWNKRLALGLNVTNFLMRHVLRFLSLRNGIM